MGNYLDKLSEFVEETRFEDLSPEAVSSVKVVVLDTLGVMVAGSQLPENAAFGKLAAARSSPATSTLFGHALKAEPMMATAVNATAGVSLEMDEGYPLGGGHPSIHCTPGALAVAEDIGADGRRLIESILVAYEVQSRLGGATVFRENVHPHGIWGTMGTAVAVAKLRGYKAGQVRDVINLAASMSPANTWTPCFEGSTVRNLYPGRSGLQGILATHLYECGFTGIENGPADVLDYIIADSFDEEMVVRGLGEDYRIQHNYFKFHACCRLNHPAVDAVLSILRDESFAPEQVEAVDVATLAHPEAMEKERPRNMLGAKFSIPFSVAATIVRGSADPSAFYPESVNDSQIRDLAARVDVRVDPKMAWGRYENPTAEVSLRLRDGRVLSGTTDITSGDPALNVPREQLLDKFTTLTAGVLGPEEAQVAISAVDRLEDLKDVREMTTHFGG